MRNVSGKWPHIPVGQEVWYWLDKTHVFLSSSWNDVVELPVPFQLWETTEGINIFLYYFEYIPCDKDAVSGIFCACASHRMFTIISTHHFSMATSLDTTEANNLCLLTATQIIQDRLLLQLIFQQHVLSCMKCVCPFSWSFDHHHMNTWIYMHIEMANTAYGSPHCL